MPQLLKCFCDSTGCAGREVSKRVFDAHSRLDRAAQARKHLEASDRVLKEQNESISACLSAMTLSDKVSGTSQHSGGRFWSKSSANEDSTERISPHYDGVSKREIADRNLRLLRDIENSLDKLEIDAKHKLAVVGIPSRGNILFPLKSLIVAVLDIQNQLVGIKQRIASVDEAKSSISSKAEDLLAILRHSQRQWIEKAKQCSEEPVLKSNAEFNAGL